MHKSSNIKAMLPLSIPRGSHANKAKKYANRLFRRREKSNKEYKIGRGVCGWSMGKYYTY